MHPYIAVPAVSLLVLRAWSNKSVTPVGILVAIPTAIAHAKGVRELIKDVNRSTPMEYRLCSPRRVLSGWNGRDEGKPPLHSHLKSRSYLSLDQSSASHTLLSPLPRTNPLLTTIPDNEQVKHDVKSQLTLSSTGTVSAKGPTASPPRNHIQVLANTGCAAILSILHYLTIRNRVLQESSKLVQPINPGVDINNGLRDAICWPKGGDLLVVGIICNYAAVAADTFSSELGILSKTAPRLITSLSWRRVPPGTNGGVTLYGTIAGLAGALTIAMTTVVLMPWCGDALARSAERAWRGRDVAAFATAVTLWGGVGSLVDSLLGGWLQESVVDKRSGKIVEGEGGKKVLVHVRPVKGVHGSSSGEPEKNGKDEEMEESRKVESGLGLLDNNGVNFAMACTMSFGGMAGMAWYWGIPLSSAFSLQ
ncbi:hypothetical protein MMC25_004964 [Agyrium rufum]|nr:hypothetical protein [Agyrium rufum]